MDKITENYLTCELKFVGRNCDRLVTHHGLFVIVTYLELPEEFKSELDTYLPEIMILSPKAKVE